MKRIWIGPALALALASPVGAAVTSAGEHGFDIARTVLVAATPDQVYAALIRPAGWWDAAHSYSGDAANMTIDAVAGGCFCERVPKAGGSAEHGRVVQAIPGKLLRISGALGPFQAMGVAGVLSWELKAVAGGTEVTQSYAVGGYIPGGGAGIAPIADGVLGGQLVRAKAYAEKGGR